MIYYLLFSILFANEPAITPPKPLSTPEANQIKKLKIESIQDEAAGYRSILESENPKASELLALEEVLNLSRHEPMYFAFGNPLTKVQFSFKYRLVKKQPIYFAYTQIMFWDLGEDSKPFRDTTYNPEFIYTYYLKDTNVMRSIDFGLWEHNSNGKDGVASRSFERAFIQLNFEHEYNKWILRFATKFGYIYGLDRTNTNIQDHIGPLELKFSLVELFRGMLDKSEFHLRFFPGGKYADHFDKGGFELGLSFRLGGLDINPAFYMQYFNGYAESLINYNERVNEFRAGFIF